MRTTAASPASTNCTTDFVTTTLRSSTMRVEARAPGRVNLIGDHTDYTGGLVFPMAIDRWVTVSGERGGERITLQSDGHPGVADIALDVTDVGAVDPGWTRLAAAVVGALRPVAGFRGRVSSTVPAGAGLSSSAAFEV